MATKHEQILKRIESLPVGEKISVRKVAKNLSVSEGTAYRAIKDAEKMGFVSTVKRVGTFRVERKQKENIEKLTFVEILNMIEGQVLGGKQGLHKSLNKFVIGAMTTEAMEQYTNRGDLLIVGNRVSAHEFAVKTGAAVLITGGFNTSEEVKRLADEKALPVLSTSYDTFTVAAMINRAIYDQLIKKEIIVVKDILTPLKKTVYLKHTEKIAAYHKLVAETKHSHFPVVNKSMRIVGMITSTDVLDKKSTLSIERVMSKNPLVVNPTMSIASAAHMMLSDNVQVCPVAGDDLILMGIVSRQDILKSMQRIQKQPQVGETIDDIIAHQLEKEEKNHYTFKVTPQMTNILGTLSYGVFTQTACDVAQQNLFALKKRNVVIESVVVYFLKPIQMDATVIIQSRALEIGRKSCKIDVEFFLEEVLVGKAIVSCQMMER